MHIVAPRRGRDLAGRDILGNVAGLEPRHHDLVDAGRAQRRDFRLADRGAFLEHQAGLADRMDRGRSLGLFERNGAELHGRASDGRRSRAVISPMIETAISAGLIAPIASPIGA